MELRAASQRHAPLSETATMPGSPLDAATPPGDLSLPAAADALTGKDGVPGETAPTF